MQINRGLRYMPRFVPARWPRVNCIPILSLHGGTDILTVCVTSCSCEIAFYFLFFWYLAEREVLRDQHQLFPRPIVLLPPSFSLFTSIFLGAHSFCCCSYSSHSPSLIPVPLFLCSLLRHQLCIMSLPLIDNDRLIFCLV